MFFNVARERFSRATLKNMGRPGYEASKFSLDIVLGGAEFPRILGTGVLKFLGLKRDAKFPRGVHNILGYLEWGCQISWDAKYPVTPC